MLAVRAKTLPSLIRSSSLCLPLTQELYQQQKREMKTVVHWLQDNRGSRKRKIINRGPSSRGRKMGKREDRGGNRYSHAKRGFDEHHITPFYRQVPKRGFNNYMFATPLRLIPLDRVIKWIEKKRINPKKVITIKRMWDEKLAPKATNFGIKLIRGKTCPDVFPYRIRVHCTRASPAAREVIEAAGGVIEYKFFNKNSLKAYLRPHILEILPKYYDNLPETFRRHKFPDYPQLPKNPMLSHIQYKYDTTHFSRPTGESEVFEEKTN